MIYEYILQNALFARDAMKQCEPDLDFVKNCPMCVESCRVDFQLVCLNCFFFIFILFYSFDKIRENRNFPVPRAHCEMIRAV